MRNLFFDFDDTLSDFNTFVPAYIASLSDVLSLDMGGVPESWSRAIAPGLAAAVERYADRFRGNPLAGYNAWIREERARIVNDVFARMGRQLLDSDSAHDLAVHLQERGLRPCNCLFGGADPALRRLVDSGFRLHFASAQESTYLRAAMTGAPSMHRFESFYGPDLVDCAKEGPEFYRRVFSDSGAQPEDAIVIDDQVTCLEWASEVGARVIQACVRQNPEPVACDLWFERWSDLPSIIDTLVEPGKLTEDLGIKE